MKICFFTAHRSESGLLHPVIKAAGDQGLDTRIIISGAHLLKKFGHTIDEFSYIPRRKIITFQFLQKRHIPAQAEYIFNRITGILARQRPDYFFVDGDRYEKFTAAAAAYLQRIPILHMGGGNITAGGCLDDDLRHSITKLAHLHFATCAFTRDRLLQMGEEPWRVHNVGNTFIDAVRNISLYSRGELEKKYKVSLAHQYVIFTMHPLGNTDNYRLCRYLLSRLVKDYVVFASYPNFDPGYKDILRALEEYRSYKNIVLEKSFGMRHYFSLLKNAAFAIGNSSSFINETPYFKKYAVLVGPRQEGRARSNNIIHLSSPTALSRAVDVVKDKQKNNVEIINPFGNGTAAKKIIAVITRKSMSRRRLLHKKFIIQD